MPFTKVADASLYWKLEGQDEQPVLVLLNSIGTDMDLWDPLLPLLRREFRLLRIDTRGHGGSVAEPGDASMAQLADDVLAVIQQSAIERFSVAGVSLGGMIGMQLALCRPEAIEKLALICTSVTMDTGAWHDRVVTVRNQGMRAVAELAMGRFLSAEFRREFPEIDQTILRQLLSMDPQGYAACSAAIRDMDLAHRISGIACPTLVVTGSRDVSTPIEGHGDYLLARIAGASHAALNASHLAPLEAPQELAATLIAFFESGSV